MCGVKTSDTCKNKENTKYVQKAWRICIKKCQNISTSVKKLHRQRLHLFASVGLFPMQWALLRCAFPDAWQGWGCRASRERILMCPTFWWPQGNTVREWVGLDILSTTRAIRNKSDLEPTEGHYKNMPKRFVAEPYFSRVIKEIRFWDSKII